MSIDLLTHLKTLHLHGMAEAWAEIQAEAPRQPPLSSERLLRRLLQAETTDRQARSLSYQFHPGRRHRHGKNASGHSAWGGRHPARQADPLL
jgi:hypothetical protein